MDLITQFLDSMTYDEPADIDWRDVVEEDSDDEVDVEEKHLPTKHNQKIHGKKGVQAEKVGIEGKRISNQVIEVSRINDPKEFLFGSGEVFSLRAYVFDMRTGKLYLGHTHHQIFAAVGIALLEDRSVRFGSYDGESVTAFLDETGVTGLDNEVKAIDSIYRAFDKLVQLGMPETTKAEIVATQMPKTVKMRRSGKGFSYTTTLKSFGEEKSDRALLNQYVDDVPIEKQPDFLEYIKQRVKIADPYAINNRALLTQLWKEFTAMVGPSYPQINFGTQVNYGEVLRSAIDDVWKHLPSEHNQKKHGKEQNKVLGVVDSGKELGEINVYEIKSIDDTMMKRWGEWRFAYQPSTNRLVGARMMGLPHAYMLEVIGEAAHDPVDAKIGLTRGFDSWVRVDTKLVDDPSSGKDRIALAVKVEEAANWNENFGGFDKEKGYDNIYKAAEAFIAAGLSEDAPLFIDDYDLDVPVETTLKSLVEKHLPGRHEQNEHDKMMTYQLAKAVLEAAGQDAVARDLEKKYGLSVIEKHLPTQHDQKKHAGAVTNLRSEISNWEGRREYIASEVVRNMEAGDNGIVIRDSDGIVKGVASYNQIDKSDIVNNLMRGLSNSEKDWFAYHNNEFINSGEYLYVSDFATKESGHGRHTMQHIVDDAADEGRGIILYSLNSAKGFYVKLGMKQFHVGGIVNSLSRENISHYFYFMPEDVKRLEGEGVMKSLIDDEPEDGVFAVDGMMRQIEKHLPTRHNQKKHAGERTSVGESGIYDRQESNASRRATDLEKFIADPDKERLFGIDGDGSIRFNIVGSKNRAALESDLVMGIKNGVLLHNHPSGSSFSSTDIETAIRYGVSETRVVTRSGRRFRMLFDPSVRGSRVLADKASKVMYDSISGYFSDAWKKFANENEGIVYLEEDVEVKHLPTRHDQKEHGKKKWIFRVKVEGDASEQSKKLVRQFLRNVDFDNRVIREIRVLSTGAVDPKLIPGVDGRSLGEILLLRAQSNEIKFELGFLHELGHSINNVYPTLAINYKKFLGASSEYRFLYNEVKNSESYKEYEYDRETFAAAYGLGMYGSSNFPETVAFFNRNKWRPQ